VRGRGLVEQEKKVDKEKLKERPAAKEKKGEGEGSSTRV
jgi:hypothetical protein